jgi:hypothetical protein
MKITDVIGLTLRDAKSYLESNGIKDYCIRVTSSPRLKCDDYDDTYRVVGIRENGIEKLEIIVCKPL